jgi:hypothetical protein
MIIKEVFYSVFAANSSAFDVWLRALSLIVIALFLLSLLFGTFVPLYTDEVATKMMLARFFAEEGKIVTAFPQCGSSFFINTPLLFYPAAIVHSFLYSSLLPFGIRISGVAMAFLWVVLFYWWIVNFHPVRQNRIYLFGCITAMLSLGITPFLLILARSEQWLVMLITLYCIFPIISKNILQRQSVFWHLVLVIAFALVTSLFFYVHPKAVFFAPLVAVSAIYTFRGKSRLKLLILSFIFACTVQNILFAKTALDCEQAPKLSAMLSAQTIDFGLIKTNPTELIRTAVGNLLTAPIKITTHILFNHSYQSGWLSDMDEYYSSAMPNIANVGSKILLLACLWGALILPLLYFRRSITSNSIGASFCLVASLWTGYVGHLALYNSWNFYSGALILPLAIVILIWVGIELFNLYIQRLWAKCTLLTILLFSLLSSYSLFFMIIPKLVSIAYSDNGLSSSQPLSVPALKYASQRLNVRELAKSCGVVGDGASRLVVDDLTYFAFDGLREPIHMVYLYEGGFGADIPGAEIAPFLAKMKSSGIIAQCTYLPEFYKIQAVRHGNLCCVKLGSIK